MKNKFNFFGTLTLAAVFGLSLASCKTDGNNSGKSTMPKYDDLITTINGDYDITPTVQSAKYETTGFKLKKDSVNIICEENIDEVTKNRLTSILEKEKTEHKMFG